MQRHVIGECPICKHDLFVTKLECTNCHTEISGQFQLSKFNYLSKEHLYFIELFIKNKGSIKQLEKELNISYPTVKKMLDEVIISLGYTVVDDEENNPKKDEILQQLADGKITSEEALKLLK
ncbi:MAG: DUF2089 domain-containing protein [Candidatus Izemoplasmataceae bacterium]|jgi:hypothetical protein|uniref:DUF2089 domain-containing protein n=1 Tax=Liberiplasma polymorphum TaxID=3374570 RepID=UPI003774BF6C